MINKVFILTGEKGCGTRLFQNLISELSNAGIDYKTISPAMHGKLYEPPAAIVIPAAEDCISEFSSIGSAIQHDTIKSCPIFTVCDGVSHKHLPAALKWNTIVDASELSKLIPNLLRLLPNNGETVDALIEAFGKSIKPSIRLLDLSGSRISDIADLAKFKLLRGAFLQQNEITNIDSLAELYNLRMLFLYGNKVSDISPLQNLNELGILYLFSNRISDIAPLKNNTELFDLRISHNKITDISALSSLKKLQTLHISGNPIKSLDAISQLQPLRELQAADCGIENISCLSNLNCLETLDLCDNAINDISCLSKLEKLSELKLYGNPLTREQIVSLRGALPLCDILF